MNARDLLGGSPLSVVIRLVILSLIVGVVLSALGITPENLFYHLNILARRLYDMGFDAFEWVAGYIILGAMVVVPIWFISRALGLLGSKASKDETR